jgi:GT2 family glycosyltransferase
MNAQPCFSVIICSVNPWKFAQASQCYERLLSGWAHEIIGIHDAASLAEGYNRGMARAVGDILVFSHDDILILDPGFAAKISERLQSYDILGFAGADHLVAATWFGAGTPHLHGAVANPKTTGLTLNIYGVADWPVVGNIEAIDGLCMIAARSAAQAVGFDAATFDGFYLYDLDFSFSASLQGYRLGVCCDIPILHESGGNFGHQHRKYAERFIAKYAPRISDAPQSQSRGRAAHFQDYRALLAAWQPDVLKRATVAMRRCA